MQDQIIVYKSFKYAWSQNQYFCRYDTYLLWSSQKGSEKQIQLTISFYRWSHCFVYQIIQLVFFPDQQLSNEVIYPTLSVTFMRNFHRLSLLGRVSNRVAMSVFLFTSSQNTHFKVSWRLLFKGYIAITQFFLLFFRFNDFLASFNFLDFGQVLQNINKF